ncbi:BPSS1780 family membrane protein [Cognatilysobacter terrigena]|uniref:BPSS1780 family membrane protein n=1 Tax=Cognatilysobacter terrigena TaxID=2488749 RepID=UPI0010606FB8|nr:BPSS1780 family membrane protein [Lysobacter terrigena]
MNVRKVPVAQGVEWMKEAVNIGRRNPRAVFGAAVLFLCTLYLASVLAVLPVASRLQGRSELSLGESIAVGIPLFVVLTLVMPVLLAGLIHVMHEAEHGRPTRARDLFAAFGHGRARPLMTLGLVQIVFNLACVAVLVLLTGPDYWTESMKALQGALSGHYVVPPEPEHPALLFFVQLLQLAFNYFSAALMLLCVPLIALSNVGIVESLRLGFRASVVNLGANLLASLVFVVGFVIAAVIVTLITAVVVGIASLIHPAFAAFVALAVWAAFAVIVLVVLVAASYYAWRDMFDAPTTAAADTRMQIEA